MSVLRLPTLFAGLALGTIAAAQTPDFSRDSIETPLGVDTPVLPSAWIAPTETHKLRVNKDDAVALQQLRTSGLVLVEYEYPSFVVFEIDGGGLTPADLAATGYEFHDEYDLVVFNGLVLDGKQPEQLLDTLTAGWRLSLPGFLPPDAGLYVVQFDGPVQDRWLAALDATGVERVHHMPMNAYVVAADPSEVGVLAELGAANGWVQHVGVYEPAFRVHAELRAAAAAGGEAALPVTVQLVASDAVRDTLLRLQALSTTTTRAHAVQQYVNVEATLRPADFARIASWVDVFQVEPRGVRTRFDEAQGQIMAGNLSGSAPSGPGYLAWLAANGFTSAQFGSFAINVVDDATGLTGHPDLASARVAFSQNPTSQTGSQGGHGYLNAHIIAGLNSGSGAANEDASGFNYGLGIAPWARVGSTAIFGSGGSSATSWESSAYASGARISSNSWGFQTSSGGAVADYDANSQEYDGIVRDARGGVAGNQEYMVVFAAGNNGSGSNTVSTPGTAKNVLTVGASENWRQTGTDGCGIGNSGANNVADIISFSSRGPVNSSGGDGRWKPELVAPGTHIQAGVPQSNYNGSSVCNAYWPSGQTLYGWSSGTSHSTPAVAGAATLVHQWFLNQSLSAPSPAMNKAFLLATGAYMTGVGANDTLPSNSQGMGRVNLADAFAGSNRLLEDQATVLGSTGATYTTSGTVASTSAPLRVVLVWTDAPGSTSGAPWVNDLDLEVNVNGTLYRGNVFSGAVSVAGGSADQRNNSESVFLPAGTSGSFTVTVRAASIAGDGVPGNGDSTDQDFALIVTNAATGPVPPTADFSGAPTSGSFPLNVAFTDASSASVTSWAWDFGDGGSSSAQHPSHTYTAAGSYTVSLTVTDAVGSDVETKTSYITVSTPAGPGVGDGSFEGQSAGAAPATPWTVDFGAGHVVNPAGVSSDNGMPSDGSQWLELSAASTNGATPPSNPGGATNPPIGGAGVSQSFSYGSGATTLSFDAAFLRNEAANQATYNDWMSVDITDGATWQNLYYADTFTATPLTSSKLGIAMTAISSVSVDLASLFPASTTATVFTVTAVVGNGADNVQPSSGYVDNFELTGTATPPPTANFSGTPTSGTAPLLVNFSDASSIDVTAWSWNFGDGGTSTAQNPSHTYTSAGNYTVTLTVTGPGGVDVLTRTNYIAVAPPTGGGALYYLSFGTTTSVPGVGSVTDEDVVSYDPSTSTWALVFDGSDVGLGGTDINALSVRADGSMLMSFNSGSFSVPGLTGGPAGTTVEDSDIVLFTPTSLGATTAGSFSFYFDGSDVGLTTNGEDIDGLHENADGSLSISVLVSASVPGVSAQDEDVFTIALTSTGSSTAGTWSMTFDGSDVGFSTTTSEDLDAVAFEAGALLFSTLGDFNGAGASGADEDIGRFTGTFGGSTAGSAALELDLSALGIATGEDVDGLTYL